MHRIKYAGVLFLILVLLFFLYSGNERKYSEEMLSENTGRLEATPRVWKIGESSRLRQLEPTDDERNLDARRILSKIHCQIFDKEESTGGYRFLESWEYEDAKHLVLHLRPNLFLDSAIPLNAQLLENIWNRARKREGQALYLSEIKNIVVKNPQTLTLESEHDYTLDLVLQHLASSLYILDPKTQYPLGCGQYRVKHFYSDGRLVLESKTGDEQYEIIPMVSPQSRALALKTHQIDAATHLSSLEKEMLPQAIWHYEKEPVLTSLLFSPQAEELDKEKRDMIQAMVDPRVWIEKLYQGNAELANSWIPLSEDKISFPVAASPFHPASRHQESMTRAFAHLGRSLRLITLSTSIRRQIALEVSKQLQAFHLRVEVQALDYFSYLRKLKIGDYDMAIFTEGESVDPRLFFYALFGTEKDFMYFYRFFWQDIPLDVTQHCFLEPKHRDQQAQKSCTESMSTFLEETKPYVPLLSPQGSVVFFSSEIERQIGHFFSRGKD